MILGPDPCGYIWISSRAAVKLVEICRGQSGGTLGAWNRGGQRWTGYNTLPLILLYIWANVRVWILSQTEAPSPQHSPGLRLGGQEVHRGPAPRHLWGSSQPSPSQFHTEKSNPPLSLSLQCLVLNHSQEILAKHPAHGWKYQYVAKHTP